MKARRAQAVAAPLLFAAPVIASFLEAAHLTITNVLSTPTPTSRKGSTWQLRGRAGGTVVAARTRCHSGMEGESALIGCDVGLS